MLGYSLFGAEELARFAYLWVIWMGVSLAVKRGAVTVITLLSGRGPAWWQRSVRTFSGISLGDLPGLRLLAHHPVRDSAQGSPAGVTSALRSRGSTRWSR